MSATKTPLIKRVLADLDTPLSVYLKLARGSNTFLLESVEGGEKWGRYSIIGLPANRIITVHGQRIRIKEGLETVEDIEIDDPLAFIDNYQKNLASPIPEGLPRFSGGLVGYFAYDTMRYVEPRLSRSSPPDELNTPDIYLMQVDNFAVFDSLRGEIILVKYVALNDSQAAEKGQAELENLATKLKQPLKHNAAQTSSQRNHALHFTSGFGREEFIRAVDKVKNYILNGDVMQVVLAQRLSVETELMSIDLYRALRHLNPSPYLFFLDLDNFQVVGSSPEVLVRVEDTVVTTRPLAGTRHRGRNPLEDMELEKELLSDPKELAEHLMLIDLSRNDVGRIAKTGTVKVTEKMSIEKYSHVMHISSNVVGELSDGLSAMDVLRATLPVGTLSGAPKIRALEIIDELEPVRRGIYGGAIGYLSRNGNMDMAIAIRTAVVKDGKVFVQAGCGVVADSTPEKEWDETMNKGRALFRAVEMAQNGLEPSSEQKD